MEKELNTPADRLQKIRDRAGFKSATEAARHFGWNENTYRSHENGTRNLSKKSAAQYADSFGANVSYLLFGEGGEFSSNPLSESVVELTSSSKFINLKRQSKPVSRLNTINNPFDKDLEAMKIEETSMHPRVRSGDIVYYVPEDQTPTRGQECLIFLKDGSVLIREYEEKLSNIVITKVLNPKTEQDPIKIEIVEMICTVVARG